MATKFYLPNFLEFIYDGIKSRGENFLFNRLQREDWLRVKNESRIRSFAENANLEDKLLLLSKLNYSCAIIVWDNEKIKTKKVEDVMIAYIDTDPNDVSKQIIKDKVFAFKEIDFIRSMQTFCKASMSKLYSINRRFLHIRENAIKTRVLQNKFEAEKNLQWYSETVQFALSIETILEAFSIDLLKFRILLHLHTAPNGATKENIQRTFSRVKIERIINDLYKCNMVKFDLHNDNIVHIDVYGLMVIEQIFNKFPN